jgi:ATP-dependent Clp protease ATP-binding subunit ClpC
VRKGVQLQVKPSGKKLLIAKGYDEVFGARPLRRAIQDELEHQIADGLLAGTYESGDILVISSKKGELKINVEHEI